MSACRIIGAQRSRCVSCIMDAKRTPPCFEHSTQTRTMDKNILLVVAAAALISWAVIVIWW